MEPVHAPLHAGGRKARGLDVIAGRVIVIGAGPAGSAAAWTMARAGIPVTLVERSTFPRSKVCGEFISPAGAPVLEHILSRTGLVTLGARQTDRITLIAGGASRTWDLPQPAWSISRSTLDEALLDAACRAGAEIVQPASVRSAEYGAEWVTVALADGRRMDCALVVHADGVGRHDAPGSRPTPAARGLVGLKCHLRAPPGVLRGLGMRAARGAYVGTIELEAGLGTCALAARANMVRKLGCEDDLLRTLWPEYSPHWREGPWLASSVPRAGFTAGGHLRSVRVGNAAAAVDPVGGEGIGLALWAGARAGALIAEAWRKDFDGMALAAMRSEFARDYRMRLRTRLPACRAAAWLLMRPALAAAALRLPDRAFWSWYRLTGKPATPVAGVS